MSFRQHVWAFNDRLLTSVLAPADLYRDRNARIRARIIVLKSIKNFQIYVHHICMMYVYNLRADAVAYNPQFMHNNCIHYAINCLRKKLTFCKSTFFFVRLLSVSEKKNTATAKKKWEEKCYFHCAHLMIYYLIFLSFFYMRIIIIPRMGPPSAGTTMHITRLPVARSCTD